MTRIDDIIWAGHASGPFARYSAEELPRRGIDRLRFDERPAAVEKWLAGLPLANITSAARELRSALEELSVIGLDPAPRIRVLQQFEPSIDYVCQALRKRYANVPPPLPSRPRAAAELALLLLEDMTRAYQLALITGEAWRRLGKAERAAALFGTMRHCSASLVESWGLYQTPPAGCWQLLHHSREEALRSGVDKRRIRYRDQAGHINDLYLQTLLTAAAGPYQMGRGEALAAFRALSPVAGHAQLLAAGDPQHADCPFRLDPTLDEGPVPNLHQEEMSEDHLLYLHTGGLVQAVQKHLQGSGMLWWRRIPAEETGERLRRLAVALGAVTERREPRHPEQKPASLLVGLSHIHRLLDAEDREYFHSSQFRSHEPRARNEDEQDIWNLIYPGEVLREIVTRDSGEAHWVSDYEPDSIEAETFWQLVNSSSRGYCLLGLDSKSRAQVGDLVIINVSRGDDPVPDWRVGIIRWLRKGIGDGVQVGIEAIAGRPTPLYARADLGDGRYSEPSRCLLLPAVSELDQPDSLIVPTLHYHEGQRVLIKGHDRTGTLELLQAIERTAMFGRYAFRQHEHTEEADYDALWADI